MVNRQKIIIGLNVLILCLLLSNVSSGQSTPFVRSIEIFQIAITDPPYTHGFYDLTKSQVPANTLLLTRIRRAGFDQTASASSFRTDFDGLIPNRVLVYRTTGDAPFYATVTAIEFDPTQVNVYKQEWSLSTLQTGSNPDLRDTNGHVYANPVKTKATSFISYTATGTSTNPSSYLLTAFQSDSSHVVIRRGSTGGGKVAIQGYYTTIEARGNQFRCDREINGSILATATSSVSGLFESRQPVKRNRTALFTTVRTTEKVPNLGSVGITSHLSGNGPNAWTITYERGAVSSSIWLRPNLVTEIIEFLEGDFVDVGLAAFDSGTQTVAIDQWGINPDNSIAGLTVGGAAPYFTKNTSNTDNLFIGNVDVYYSGSALILDHDAIPGLKTMEGYWQIIKLRTQIP
jgi:hypothetical protein